MDDPAVPAIVCPAGDRSFIFGLMMLDEKLQMFRNRLTKVFRHVQKQAKKQDITCYRVYDHDLPEFPLCIEVYQENICLAEYKRHHGMSDDTHDAWLDACIEVVSQVMGVAVDRIYVRQRQRKAGRQGQYEKLDSSAHFFSVREAGLEFLVNLQDYLDTGLFLDHRITRGLVRSEAAGKRVLNLFCYTGSFSVYAAAGGARAVDSVDLSKTYLGWAKQNMELNGLLQEDRQAFIHADVLQWLDEQATGTYDLVILDPPTFSNSKRMKDFLDIQRDHADLINKTLARMNPGAVLYFSTNCRTFKMDSEKVEAAGIKDITKGTTPFDFQGKLYRFCYRIVK